MQSCVWLKMTSHWIAQFYSYNPAIHALPKPEGAASLCVIALEKIWNKIPSLQNTILPFSSKHEIFLPHLIHLQHQKSRRQGLRWDARAIAPPPLPCYCTIISSPRDISTIILASSHFIFTTRIIKQKVSTRFVIFWINLWLEFVMERIKVRFELLLWVWF